MVRPVDELRAELRAAPLDVATVAADPLEQFRAWFAEAQAAGVDQPEAMTLATAGADRRPSARVVLLRGLDARGFAFYTHLESEKGVDLRENPRAALVFHWHEVTRQVRVTGPVARVPDEEAAAYFATRPLGSRIGAWSSPQSQVLGDRAELERLVGDTEARFAGVDPPLPPFWGGFVVGLETLELWQSRESRLHDRVRYRRAPDGWIVERLAP
ncbi:MAG TPA: pyridoxamine 5'-phosphate oxidase [Acidimicrobiia bacterium]|jgi:pyridoxamine 5'-phosphate oxidase|nr:pyridoxamine 5'-phosphate oxidase [Acidimicrobiia bacterium]